MSGGRVVPGRPAGVEMLFILAALTAVQVIPAEVWRSGVAPLGLVCALLWFNARRFPGSYLCWPNIFLVTLALFHLAYYVLAANGLIAALSFMPNLQYSPDIALALQLFASACLALEAGALAAAALGRRHPAPPIGISEGTEQAFFRLGVLVTALGFLLFCIYVDQLGGLSVLGRSDYSSYVQFLQSSDPRFAALSITYLPAGLLLMYVFLERPHSRYKVKSRCILSCFMLFTLWLLWIGDRGAAFLDWAALAYLHHLRVQPISWRKAAGLAVAIILLIGPVRAIRNVAPSARGQALATASLNPLHGVSEMGLTFRPFLALVQQRQKGTSFGTKPYVAAIEHAIPNFGAFNKQGPSFRTTTYVGALVDPVSAALGIGTGGSAIGEAYLDFGVPGVVVTFALLGAFIAGLECRAAWGGSAAALAMIPLTFYSLGFYVRDDVYGVARALIWAGLAVIAVRVTARGGNQSTHLRELAAREA
jgi:hypothetical protein